MAARCHRAAVNGKPAPRGKGRGLEEFTRLDAHRRLAIQAVYGLASADRHPVTQPRARASLAGPARDGAAGPGDGMRFAQLNVMGVEDHGFQRRMALRPLSEVGVLRTSEAADSETAMRLLDGNPDPPDVVIVDLDMPSMAGIEFIGHVAQKKLARAVVVASALDPARLNTGQTMARAYGLRVLGCVEKPMTASKLAEAIAHWRRPKA